MNRNIEFVYPVRIIKADGIISGGENFLINRDEIASFGNDNLIRMKNENGIRSYIILDFGKEICGGVRIVTAIVKGLTTKIRLVFGESVSEAMSSIGEKGATNHHSPRDFSAMISNMSALEFGRTGFRFVKIELEEDNAEVAFKSVIGLLSLPEEKLVGKIETDDESINKILETAVYTCTLNMQDGYFLDGIKRDRLVWSGDMYAEIKTALCSFGNTPHTKRSLDFVKATTPDGFWMNNIPSYDAWWVINVCEYYNYSGDSAYLTKNLNNMNAAIKELDACIDEDGTMDFGKTGRKLGLHKFFLDWPTDGTKDAVTGTALLILYAARIFKETAKDAACDEAICSINRKLQRYISEETSKKQIAAFQVLCGQPSDRLKRLLEKGGASGFSTFMSYFILKALIVSGSDHTVDYIKEYYGGMIGRGATAFWEDFDVSWLDGSGRIDEIPAPDKKDLHADYGQFCYKGLRHSLCHGWSSGVLPFFIEEIVGLKILEPGFKKIAVRPKPGGLKYISAKIPTPYGVIEIKTDTHGVDVRVPEGIEIIKTNGEKNHGKTFINA